MIIYSFSLCLWVRYLGVAWLGGPGSGFLNEVVVRCQLGLQSWKGSKAAVSCGCWQEASILLHMGLSTSLLECIHAVASGFPQPVQALQQTKPS